MQSAFTSQRSKVAAIILGMVLFSGALDAILQAGAGCDWTVSPTQCGYDQTRLCTGCNADNSDVQCCCDKIYSTATYYTWTSTAAGYGTTKQGAQNPNVNCYKEHLCVRKVVVLTKCAIIQGPITVNTCTGGADPLLNCPYCLQGAEFNSEDFPDWVRTTTGC